MLPGSSSPKRIKYSTFISNYYQQALVLIILMGLFGFVWRSWPYTWDDSGITLAFSRNFARFGDIIPTERTGRVEGYSSFFWMLLNSGYFFAGLSPSSVLLIAKTTSTVFVFINIILYWALLDQTIITPQYKLIAILLYAINGYTISAAVDGMETSLYALLVISSFFLFFQRNKKPFFHFFFCTISALLILIRHEGFLFLVPFCLAILVEKREKVFFEPAIWVWMILFTAYHVWHYSFFHELLTNPMLAKRHWPYRPVFAGILDYLLYYGSPLLEFIYKYMGLAIITIVSFVTFKFPQDNNVEGGGRKDIIGYIALCGIFIICITGANWGAAARLSYPALPFILLFILLKLDTNRFFSKHKLARSISVIGIAINLVIVIQSSLIPPPDVITLAGVEKRASAIDIVQEFIGRPEITFAGVDMGGLLLYHGSGKKVIDLGLLCDKELAKNGYKNYSGYIFEQNQPEIIEAHGFWVNKLRETDQFTKFYTPIMTITNRNEQILYYRNDIADQIKTMRNLPYATAKDGFKDIDQPTLGSLGSFQVLDLRDPTNP